MFNSRQYEWADISVILGGRDLTGIRAIEYAEKFEREGLYAKGRFPHSIQTGNAEYEGEITVLQSEYEALVLAGNGSIMGLSLDAIVSYGNPLNGDAMLTDIVQGIRFTETKKGMKQGDKFMEMKLAFKCISVKNQS
jgi:hypothetical protein